MERNPSISGLWHDPVEKKLKMVFHIQRIQERDLPSTQVSYPNVMVRELRVSSFEESLLATSLSRLFPFLVGMYEDEMNPREHQRFVLMLIDVKSP